MCSIKTYVAYEKNRPYRKLQSQFHSLKFHGFICVASFYDFSNITKHSYISIFFSTNQQYANFELIIDVNFANLASYFNYSFYIYANKILCMQQKVTINTIEGN